MCLILAARWLDNPRIGFGDRGADREEALNLQMHERERFAAKDLAPCPGTGSCSFAGVAIDLDDTVNRKTAHPSSRVLATPWSRLATCWCRIR
jgi:hypothetical protein